MSSRILDADAARAFKPWRPSALGDGVGAPGANGHANGYASGASGARGPGSHGATLSNELDRLREAARAEGYAAGLAAGREAGRTQIEHEAARVRALADAACARWDDAQAQLASQVLDLALHVARKVLHADARVRREALLAVVQEALHGLVDAAQRAEIHVHPADATMIRGGLGEELSRGQWKLVEDQRIEPGGCRIQTPHGEIDATLATRWRRVLDALGRDFSWTDTDE